MLFERRLREGIADRSITVAFRRWRRPQVRPGGRYRTGIDIIEMEAVDAITPRRVTVRDARAAGYPDRAAALADLSGPVDGKLYRLRFHVVDGPDPRTVLAAQDSIDAAGHAELDRRLDRLDAASGYGPWTRATLAAIAARPGVRAGDLAAAFDREIHAFKADVRKLKALGLSESLAVGYQLSARGKAYLAP